MTRCPSRTSGLKTCLSQPTLTSAGVKAFLLTACRRAAQSSSSMTLDTNFAKRRPGILL
eukprot:CAMPEP_0170590424 /NCGR_PEP_ID=MMETSP0224-20130122/11865_1 /TAXON_ID=285029 /ORGANISM="Togula jolla, Strain CCCM 725" /LENGTH=58 /DNA_ID=CAMNT_0010914225 /DNA_START=581 /DNA_END=757 /DNA_ORIENTATION=-